MTDITVRREALQVVFDSAIDTLDFGSGFLDDEEVEALREIAVNLGVDPMRATPEKFHCKYEGKHCFIPPKVLPDYASNGYDKEYSKTPRCLRCHQVVTNQEYLDWCSQNKDTEEYEEPDSR